MDFTKTSTKCSRTPAPNKTLLLIHQLCARYSSAPGMASLKLKEPLCVHACVRMCVCACAHTGADIWVWRPEVGIRCLPQSFSNLGLTAWLEWLASKPRNSLVSACPVLRLQIHTVALHFKKNKWVPGIKLRSYCLYKSLPTKPSPLLPMNFLRLFKWLPSRVRVENYHQT